MYSRWHVTVEVADVVKGVPWMEILSARPMEKSLDEGALIHIVKARTFFDLKRFAAAARNYGRSCLMLSGGGTLGWIHLGVGECFLQDCYLARNTWRREADFVIAIVVGLEATHDGQNGIAILYSVSKPPQRHKASTIAKHRARSIRV